MEDVKTSKLGRRRTTVSERRHSDEEWRELGEHLYRAHGALADAYIKASEMWGNQEDVPRRILQMHGALGDLRVELDDEYHHEKRERTFGFPDPIFGADQRIRSRGISL